LRPFMAKLGYGPKFFSLDRLKIGQPDSVALEGSGNFDRAGLTGKLALDSTAASLPQLTALVAPFAPSLASRLNALGTGPGPVRTKLVLTLGKDKARADGPIAYASLDLEAPQLKGAATLTAIPDLSALSGIDLDALRRTAFSLESKLSSDQGRTLLALLGLDRAVAAGDGPAQFEGSVAGAWRSPLRLKAKLTGAGLQAEAQGTAEPWAQDAGASINLSVRGANLAPLLDLKPADRLAQNINLSSRVSFAGNKLTFDDLDSTISGSRLRGRVAVTLDGDRNVDGEVGLVTLDLAPAFALAIGASGRDAAEPLGAGLVKGWRGRVAFQALRGALPGGGELRPVSGIVKSDGQSLTFEAIKGGIGGGEATATIDVRPGANGIALNASVQLTGVDGAALRYRRLAMPAGRTSMQLTLTSQGRSASALTGALSGSGTATLESARISGLDPQAFDVAMHASDIGQATDDTRLRQIIEPVLSAGGMSVKAAQIPFSIGDGRLRVDATTLESDSARAIISGGYDIPADQADIRVTLASTAAGQAASRPEIQLFATGSPDALHRTVDVASLSAWLAVRAIDRETRRLDWIERGEPPPLAMPASIPPGAAAPSLDGEPSDQPTSNLPLPGRDLRRPPPKPRVSAPRPPAAAVSPGSTASPGAPVVSQQLAPLPPPIEVRPPPGPPPPLVRPKPKPPLALTPPATSPQRPAF
jgi:AsmA-like C-terminal region